MSRVASELETHAAGVARALEDLSEHRDIVTRIEAELTEARLNCAKAEQIFQDRRDAMLEKFPELRPAGWQGQRVDTPPVPVAPTVIEVDDDTPPDPLGRGADPDDDDPDHLEFLEH